MAPYSLTSDPLVPDATAFFLDALPQGEPPPSGGLVLPSEALSVARERDDSRVSRFGIRAASVAGQGVLVSNLKLFVRFDQASEVSEMVRLYRLPGTPKWICGLANLHGNLVPVLDLASFFNLPSEASEKSMLLVLGHGEAAVALIISGVPERLRFDDSERIPAPVVGERLQPYVPGAFMRGNDLWLELEHDRLLGAFAALLTSPANNIEETWK